MSEIIIKITSSHTARLTTRTVLERVRAAVPELKVELVYSSVDLLLLSDKNLAKYVMNAWTMYVRSNCLVSAMMNNQTRQRRLSAG